MSVKLRKIEKVYSFLWSTNKRCVPPQNWHFNKMQEVIPEPIVKGSIGMDVGSGCGYDTYIMAKNNPLVKFLSIDISNGLYTAKELVSGLSNVWLVKSSVLNIPLKETVLDFAYSFGVLHHTENPQKGLTEIARVLKKSCPAFIYLYEDHSDNFIKYISLKAVSLIRCITLKLPNKAVYLLSWLFSPLVFIIFSLPAKFLSRFESMRYLAAQIPFNFASAPFSLAPDLYDRFSAPIEYRFSKKQIQDMFLASGFSRPQITKIKGIAGWVAWGYKK